MGPLPEIRRLIVAFIIACVLLGVALAFAAPCLWVLVKPWLHAVTA